MNTGNIEKILAASSHSGEDKLRIIQELVPGKQITLAHIIANPDSDLYRKLGLDPRIDYSHSAIGVLTVSPSETTIIAADICMKAAEIDLGFVDRFSGTLVITGTISDVEAAFRAATEYAEQKLGFTVCEVTRT
jgi:ethanolamine utilization protein EutS